MKKIFLLIALIVICILSFLAGNYFYIRGQYKDMYLNCISQKYDINDIEIEKMALSFKKNNFKCYYKQKSTGQHFIASKSSGGYIIEYAYDSNGNSVWNDSWDFSNSDADDTFVGENEKSENCLSYT